MAAHVNQSIVVTGTGVVTAIGETVPKFWASLKQGRCGLSQLEGVDLADDEIRIGGQVKAFDPKERLGCWTRDKTILHADRYSWLAAAAASEAIAQARFAGPFSEPYRVACLVGSAAGGQTFGEKACRDRFVDNKRAVHPMFLPRIIGSSAAAHIGIEYGVKGPTFGVCSAGTSAAHAISLGCDYIRNGVVEIAIVGGTDSALTLGVMLAAKALNLLSPEGCFPFSRGRSGTVLAEGAGILVLESARHAKARGATVLAELSGFAMTSNATDMVEPSAEGLCEAMRRALNDARLAPSEIGYINAHGAGTRLGDLCETEAIKETFPQARRLPISSTKSMHGHTMGASGAIEAIACIEAMRSGWLPPTIGLAQVDDACDLDYISKEARRCDVRHAMSMTHALGGFNTSMIFGLPPTH
jgi:nodulation protein E